MTNLDELVALGQLVKRTDQLSAERKEAIMHILSEEVKDSFSTICSTIPISKPQVTPPPLPKAVEAPLNPQIKHDPEIFGRQYKDGITRKAVKRNYPNSKIFAPDYWEELQRVKAVTVPSLSAALNVSESAAFNMLGKFLRAGLVIKRRHADTRRTVYAINDRLATHKWEGEPRRRYVKAYYDKKVRLLPDGVV